MGDQTVIGANQDEANCHSVKSPDDGNLCYGFISSTVTIRLGDSKKTHECFKVPRVFAKVL